MKKDFNFKLQSIQGDSLKDDKDEEISLKTICLNSLLMGVPNETLDGVTKYNYWKLAKIIQESSEPVEVTSEQIAILKERIGKLYSANVVGSCYDILENN